MKDGKPTVYVDMDDTAVDFSKQLRLYQAKYPGYQYPQSIIGFFSDMEEITGFKDAWNKLSEHYDMRFLSRPSPYNLGSYTEKAVWVRNNMGGIEALEKLNLNPDKSVVGEKGDYLIDDWDVHGQHDFPGEFMHFGRNGAYKNWEEVVRYLMSKVGGEQKTNLGNCKECGAELSTKTEFIAEECDTCLYD